MYSDTRFKKSALRNAVLLALSINGAALALNAGDAQAALSACGAYTPLSPNNSINFTMLAANGGGVGGTNDVVMAWDGQAYTSSSDYTGPGSGANVTMSSTAPFFGHAWTAHDIQVFAPGSYSFDTALAGGNPEAGTLLATVGAGQLGMHMLFNWNNNNNIDVFVVLAQNSIFGSGLLYSTVKSTSGARKCDSSFTGTITKNCLWDDPLYGSAGAPTKNQAWMLASTDPDGDGVNGIPMATGGPFAGFNANFNFRGTLTLTAGTPCSAAAANQFTFTDITGATPNTPYTSNTITVSGLGAGTANVSIAGGTYSKNGGTYTSADGTAVDGDTFSVRQTSSVNSDGTTTNTSLSISGTNDTYSVTVIDKKPNAFSFTSQTGVATSTTVESDTITVGGMDTELTTPINITGGEYSKNGGTYISVAGTVTNGDTVKVHQLSSATGSTTTIATLTLGQVDDGTAVSGTFSVRTAGGLNSTGNNFTMLDKTGGVTGGTNDVVMDWDQQVNTSTNDPVTPATAHMHLSTVTAFFGYNWTAHHIRVFGPGTYTINVDCTTPQLEDGTCTANADPNKNYTFTVGANQVGAHMLFDWNQTKNIDVVDIWNQSAKFTPSTLYTGEVGCANAAQVWDYMSGDWDNDAQNGAKMIDGPFSGFSANFNLRTTTPALSCSAYTPTVNVSSPSGAGGCSISPTPTHLLARGDWWLVAGFLAWLGGIQMRLKRKTRS
jgi:hypothetical protein